MALLLLKACVVIYGVAAVLGFVQVFNSGQEKHRIAVSALVLGVLGHLAVVVTRSLELGSFPMANTHDALSLFGFTLAVTALGIVGSRRVPQVAPLAAAVVTVIVGFAVFIEPAVAVPAPFRSPWLPVHIALAYLGSSAFVVSGMVAGVYLLQDARLRQKRPVGGPNRSKLPALDLLDRIGMRLIEIGFPLMTLALLSGALYGREVWGTWWKWELRNVLSVMIWGLFALLLHFRLTIGWRGRKAALLTMVGVAVTLISLVGLNLLGFGHHGQDIAS